MFLTKTSLSRKVNTKWFKIVNVILCIIIVGVLNIDSIISFFGGDFDKQIKLYVIDKVDGNVYDTLNSQLNSSTTLLTQGNDNAYEVVKYDKTLEDARKEVEEDKDIIVLEFNKNEKEVIDVTLLTKEYMDLKDMVILNTA